MKKVLEISFVTLLAVAVALIVGSMSPHNKQHTKPSATQVTQSFNDDLEMMIELHNLRDLKPGECAVEVKDAKPHYKIVNCDDDSHGFSVYAAALPDIGNPGDCLSENKKTHKLEWHPCATPHDAENFSSTGIEETPMPTFASVYVTGNTFNGLEPASTQKQTATFNEKSTPPNAFALYSATDVVQTPTPIFNVLSPVNTTAQVPTLSKPWMIRVTGPSTDQNCTSFGATKSGGTYDNMANTQVTMIAVACENGYWEFLGFNPTNMAVTSPTGSALRCPGAGGFTRKTSTPTVFYCRPNAGKSTPLGVANGTTIYALTFGYTKDTSCGLKIGQCPDVNNYTWSKYFDYATCPQAPQNSGQPTWASVMGIGTGDTPISSAFSWTAGQGSGRYMFAYAPGWGCHTLDVQGNGTNPLYYANIASKGVITIDGVTNKPFLGNGTIHDSIANQLYVQLAITGCQGVDCPAPWDWKWTTNVIYPVGSFKPIGGHQTLTKTYFVNADNPGIHKRLVTTPGSPIQIGNTNCSPCEDSHIGSTIADDTSMIVGNSDGLPPQFWTAPYKNETFQIVQTPPTQTIYRMNPTWSSGPKAQESFSCQYAIGHLAGNIWFFSTDMLGALGQYQSQGKTWNRCDVVAVGLKGQK